MYDFSILKIKKINLEQSETYRKITYIVQGTFFHDSFESEWQTDVLLPLNILVCIFDKQGCYIDRRHPSKSEN